jgi:hypothetical protein
VDFKNKRVGRVISRLICNKKKYKDDTIPTIMIDQDSSEEDHMEYDFVSNLPPFLQDCKGFSGIQSDLKAKEGFSKKEQQYSVPDLEPDHCHDCLAWAQRYYSDMPYLQMRLNQVMMQNKELEEENYKLKLKAQKSVACTVRRSKQPGDVVIKYSTNVNVITGSKLYHPSLSNA